MNIVIIGLGYVGLPLACLCAKKGHRTVGLDVNEEIVDCVNRGKSHILDPFLDQSVASVKGILRADVNPEVIQQADVVVVCVPTPVDELYHPDLTPVRKACEAIAANMQRNQLIIIESTIYPGTVDEVCVPILERSGLKAGVDFGVSHCPERIDPGNLKWHVGNIPRICGGIDEASTQRTAAFYRSVIDAEITPLKSVKAAEAVKIMENTFRDVNIAFMNEMARSFDLAGIDILEVIRGATTKPFAFLPHFPGCGVGGHCIAVDPYYLIEKAKSYGFDHQFLSLARKINNGMPEYTLELVTKMLNDMGKSIKGTRIGVLGVTYKGNVDDTRESPAFEIIELLEEHGAELIIFDPNVPKESTVGTLEEAFGRSEILVVCANHRQFQAMDYVFAAAAGVKGIVDGRNCLDRDAVLRAGMRYKGVGH